MTTFRCAACGHRSTPRDQDVVRVLHQCPARAGELVPLVPLDATMFELYCGNPTCRGRLAGVTHWVDVAELPDGEIWACAECRAR